MNPTMEKFGYPGSLVREYRHWAVLLRPQQTTLGALVLVCKDEAEAFSKISAEAFGELPQVTAAIEATLKASFQYDKINYLMLMMVDRDVHFHVIPRYAGPRTFARVEFHDPGWPGPPELARANQAGESLSQELLQLLRRGFQQH